MHKSIHRKITRAGMPMGQWHETQCCEDRDDVETLKPRRIVYRANLGQDSLFPGQFLNARHVDCSDFDGARRLLKKEWSIIGFCDTQILECCDCDIIEKALEAFGRLLHCLQDFYSHTNWIEKHSSSAQPVLWDYDQGNPPADILSGNWWMTPHHGPSNGPSHGELNKDHADSDSGGRRILQGPNSGKTLHEIAVAWATQATAEAFDRFRRTAPHITGCIEKPADKPCAKCKESRPRRRRRPRMVSMVPSSRSEANALAIVAASMALDGRDPGATVTLLAETPGAALASAANAALRRSVPAAPSLMEFAVAGAFAAAAVEAEVDLFDVAAQLWKPDLAPEVLDLVTGAILASELPSARAWAADHVQNEEPLGRDDTVGEACRAYLDDALERDVAVQQGEDAIEHPAPDAVTLHVTGGWVQTAIVDDHGIYDSTSWQGPLTDRLGRGGGRVLFLPDEDEFGLPPLPKWPPDRGILSDNWGGLTIQPKLGPRPLPDLNKPIVLDGEPALPPNPRPAPAPPEPDPFEEVPLDFSLGDMFHTCPFPVPLGPADDGRFSPFAPIDIPPTFFPRVPGLGPWQHPFEDALAEGLGDALGELDGAGFDNDAFEKMGKKFASKFGSELGKWALDRFLDEHFDGRFDPLDIEDWRCALRLVRDHPGLAVIGGLGIGGYLGHTAHRGVSKGKWRVKVGDFEFEYDTMTDDFTFSFRFRFKF